MSDSKQLVNLAINNFLNSHNIHFDFSTDDNDSASAFHFKLPISISHKLSTDLYIVYDDAITVSMGHVPISFQRADLPLLAEFAHRVNKELIHGTLLFDYDKCTLDFKVTIPNIAFTDDAEKQTSLVILRPYRCISKIVQIIPKLAGNSISLIQAAKFVAEE